MFLYQVIFIIMALIALIAIIIRQKEGRGSYLSFVVSLLVVGALVIIAIFPELTANFASIFGIKRGLDFVFIVGILGTYIFLYKIYNMLDALENELTDLVRKLALKDEYNKKNDD